MRSRTRRAAARLESRVQKVASRAQLSTKKLHCASLTRHNAIVRYPPQPPGHGVLLSTGRDLERARQLEEETLRLSKAKLGNEHPMTLHALASVASDYSALGMHEQVLPLCQEILRFRHKRLGEDHPETIQSMHNLADAYLSLGRIEEVLPLYRDAVRINELQHGEKDARTLRSRADLANGLRRLGQHTEAVQEIEEVLRLKKIVYDENSPEIFSAIHEVSRIYSAAGQFDKALDLEEKTRARALKVLGPDHEDSIYCLDMLSLRYLETAVMQAWLGRQESLARTAERMIANTRDSNLQVALERTAKVWSFLPQATPERRAEILSAATRAVERGKNSNFLIYFQMALGMSQYRSGLYADADSTPAATVASQSAKEDTHVQATCAFYRAMGLHHQGNAAEALSLAKATAQRMKPLPADESQPLAGNSNIDDLIVWMACKEAKSLIGFEVVETNQTEQNSNP